MCTLKCKKLQKSSFFPTPSFCETAQFLRCKQLHGGVHLKLRCIGRSGMSDDEKDHSGMTDADFDDLRQVEAAKRNCAQAQE